MDLEQASLDSQRLLLRVLIAFLVVSWPLVFLRFYSRAVVLGRPAMDDVFLALAQLSFTAYSAVLIVTILKELQLPAAGGETIFVLYNHIIVSECLYLLVQTFLKISICFLFLRFMSSPKEKYFVYGIVCVCSVINLLCVNAIIWECGVPGNYLFRNLSGQCVSKDFTSAMAYLNAATIATVDVIFAGMPVWLVRKLHVNTRTKILVYVILSIAASGVICSFIRFQYVSRINSFENFILNMSKLGIWSTAEMGTSIIAACLITLRPLVRRFLFQESANASPGASDPNTIGHGNRRRVNASDSILLKSDATEIGAEL